MLRLIWVELRWAKRMLVGLKMLLQWFANEFKFIDDEYNELFSNMVLMILFGNIELY